MLGVHQGDGHPTWGATWIDLGRLRLIWCASKHPNRWMIVWRRGLPELRQHAMTDAPELPSWFELPLKARRWCWRETDYGRLPWSPEFKARLLQSLSAAQLEAENARSKIATDATRARALLARARRPPCESCQRTPPCRERCLRTMLLPDASEPVTK